MHKIKVFCFLIDKWRLILLQYHLKKMKKATPKKESPSLIINISQVTI